ncbi:MAG TPA: aminopeptidase [Solirubrobacteraceae bacterium]|nr:aminopeptidase [Solirubrobacteraceae bacterium]
MSQTSGMTQEQTNGYVEALAELAVRFGANVQPGQVVDLHSEPGKEAVARAVAQEAYRAGAKFVDLRVFDPYLKRARAQYADPETLRFVPSWYGQRTLALGDCRAARIMLTGPVAPRIMEDVDPALAARDMLPATPESLQVVNQRTTNWTILPCPTPQWAALVHPDLEPSESAARLWDEVAHVCRLDEPDPPAAWRTRLERLSEIATRLDGLRLDSLRYAGPGTDLTIGLLDSSRWISGQMETVDGIHHCPNVPTEEIFTTPDPERVQGVVRSTKPLFTSSRLITGLTVRFEGGRAVAIDADHGAETLRGLSQRDPGAARLGEVSLVDRESRIAAMHMVFYDTLIDENAASHIALGHAIEEAVGREDLDRVNRSEIHIDFMIGSDEVAVTGVTREGREVPLLRGGDWQI